MSLEYAEPWGRRSGFRPIKCKRHTLPISTQIRKAQKRVSDHFDPESHRLNEPLAKHARLRIGGPAAIWARISSISELATIREIADETEVPVYPVGLGSNVLFPDEGIQGIVLRLSGQLGEIEIADSNSGAVTVRVGAAVPNAHLVRTLRKRELFGAEFLNLIPGTVGGAVAMNAGTKEYEIRRILENADVLTRQGYRKGADCAEPQEAQLPAGWTVKRLTPDRLDLDYRHSNVRSDEVVVSAKLRLRPQQPLANGDYLEADKKRREQTQPYREPSVGSTFKNPPQDSAGRLIDEVGLKGTSVGDAKISELHGNFFINTGEATAADFLRLMATAQKRVAETFDVELEPEVDFVGFDGQRRLDDLRREVLDD